MEVLITTYDSFCLFDVNNHQISVVDDKKKYYYGITWDSNLNVYLGHTNLTIEQLSKSHSPDQDCGYITKNNIKQYEFVNSPHQLNYYDDMLVLANTGRNCISLFEKTSRLDYYVNSSIIWDILNSQKKGMHFNSIFKFKNKLYVLAHNFNSISDVYTLDWPSLEVERVDSLCKVKWSHSMWVTDDFFLVGGGYGELYDFKTNKIIWQINNESSRYIIRGFAANEDYLFVGCSPHITDRKLRYTNKLDVFIAVFDIKSDFKYLDSISIKDKTAINEIRLLNEVDKCHNNTIMTKDHINNIFNN